MDTQFLTGFLIAFGIWLIMITMYFIVKYYIKNKDKVLDTLDSIKRAIYSRTKKWEKLQARVDAIAEVHSTRSDNNFVNRDFHEQRPYYREMPSSVRYFQLYHLLHQFYSR